MENRIDAFKSSAQRTLCSTYPDTQNFINAELSKLDGRWNEFKQKAQGARKAMNLTIEYFTLGEEV